MLYLSYSLDGVFAQSNNICPNNSRGKGEAQIAFSAPRGYRRRKTGKGEPPFCRILMQEDRLYSRTGLQSNSNQYHTPHKKTATGITLMQVAVKLYMTHVLPRMLTHILSKSFLRLSSALIVNVSCVILETIISIYR